MSGGTVATGPVATGWVRLCALEAALGLEIHGLQMHSGKKASHFIKEWLEQREVQYQGRPVTVERRIPARELLPLFHDEREKWGVENQAELRKNITTF